MELRDKLAMAILQPLMMRHGEEGYSDVCAIIESYKLADEALGIRGANAKVPPSLSKIAAGLPTTPAMPGQEVKKCLQ